MLMHIGYLWFVGICSWECGWWEVSQLIQGFVEEQFHPFPSTSTFWFVITKLNMVGIFLFCDGEREKERKRERERDYEELAPVINYGSWEVPWSALCKLETQESQWCSLKAWKWIDSSPDLKADNQECWGGQENNVPAHPFRQRVNSTFLCLCVLFSPSEDWMIPWGEPSALLGLPIQMLISSRNTLIDTSRSNI